MKSEGRSVRSVHQTLEEDRGITMRNTNVVFEDISKTIAKARRLLRLISRHDLGRTRGGHQALGHLEETGEYNSGEPAQNFPVIFTGA